MIRFAQPNSCRVHKIQTLPNIQASNCLLLTLTGICAHHNERAAPQELLVAAALLEEDLHDEEGGEHQDCGPPSGPVGLSGQRPPALQVGVLPQNPGTLARVGE